MPNLHRFRLERKSCVEKPRKHSENIKRMSYKFARLFQFSELTIPSELQKFVSCERTLSDTDFSRNNNSKIRVILKINESKDTPSCLTFNKNQNCVGLIDPTPSRRSQTSNNNVNLFPFDSIFTENDQQNTLLESSIIEPIEDFFKGKDACIFSFGNAGLGKTKTMLGSDQSLAELGIIPCALVWVFKVMEQLKTSNKTRYAIRISALEIANKNIVRDLLVNSTESCLSKPGILLLEKTSSVLSNQKELPANNLLEAARILDNVLSARSSDNGSLTHLQVIIHLYQYQLDNNHFEEGLSKPVLGGRSKLHFLDLGSGRHSNDDPNILSLQGMSKVILALYTSQRHIPYKENVLTQLLKETLSVTAVTTMVVHISTKEQTYNETLQIVQLASKLYRTRSRKSRSVGFLVTDETSSCSSSSSGFHSRRLRPHMGIGAARRSSGNSSASSELDLTSASELSCCETVIFRGNTNNSESEKSLDQNPLKMNLLSESSESDLILSDRESSKDYISSSSNLLSPSQIRRRKISPRTNARAWPSSNSGLNIATDNTPELWVDGPNAVYKSEQKQPETPISTTPKLPFKESNNQPKTLNVTKPTMMSKETQCDDVWDSSSSLTDGSSHSNTLDRKDHRPLSDISECTEDTESNVATETDLGRINMMDDMCPMNDLDELLESTFALSPLHQDIQPKLSCKQTSYSIKPLNQSTLSEGVKEKENCTKNTQENVSETQNNNLKKASSNIEVEKTIPAVKNIEVRKHYHSASDSKRSSKSEQKDRKSKSKCKKCSKKSSDQPSTSITSSNSTDFSRVESWIQKVEYEFQTSNNANNEDDVFLDNVTSYKCNQHGHHQSQPDISCYMDRLSGGPPQSHNLPVEYKWPPDQSWNNNEINHVRYSLYGSYQMQPIPSDVVHMQMQSVQSNMTYGPQMSCVPHMSCHSTSMAAPPFHSPLMGRHHVLPSNISYNRHSVLMTQPPLPPLPLQTSSRDNKSGQRNNAHVPLSFDAQRINSSPSLIPKQPKSKTLPRDMYSDSSSPLRRNKSDLHPSTAPFKEQSMTALYEIKSKDKIKKESKNIMSILFAPFISLRNKINRGKCTMDKQTASSENDIDKSVQRELEGNKIREVDWPLKSQKDERDFILSSPYHLITPPKKGTLPTESSGHGSDSSSLLNRPAIKEQHSETSRQHKCRTKSTNNTQKNGSRQRPTSSGYGSIIIKGDSEVSSHNDSSSEYSISGQNQPKMLTSHSKIKQSISLSNCKSVLDNPSCANKAQSSEVVLDCSASIMNDNAKVKSISTAQDLILQEKLRISLNEERKMVIDYIETNRLRGIPVDASVMNLICFKGVDNFEISNLTTRDECQSLIERIALEIEQLKHKLTQAQHNLLLITSFDCNPCQ